ncbi:MAG: DNA topoisomerase VI subunit B, partial [Halobacteriota archaeon]
ITAELLEAGVRKEYDAEFYAAVTRDASVHGGDPFVVEAAIAYGGELDAESPGELLRFANRVPLVYQEGACAITQTLKDVGWKNYGLDDDGLPRGPVVVAVHLASTNVPFTSESKDAVASVPEIESEVERAVREVAREMKSHIRSAESRRKRREKERVIQNIVPQIAEKVGEVTGEGTPPTEGTMARILNKVYVDSEAENGRVTVEARNYSGSNKSLEIHCFVDGEPGDADGEGDVDVVDLDDEYDVVWKVDVPKGGKAALSYDGEPGVMSVDGVDDELVEVRA